MVVNPPRHSLPPFPIGVAVGKPRNDYAGSCPAKAVLVANIPNVPREVPVVAGAAISLPVANGVHLLRPIGRVDCDAPEGFLKRFKEFLA